MRWILISLFSLLIHTGIFLLPFPGRKSLSPETASIEIRITPAAPVFIKGGDVEFRRERLFQEEKPSLSWRREFHFLPSKAPLPSLPPKVKEKKFLPSPEKKSSPQLIPHWIDVSREDSLIEESSGKEIIPYLQEVKRRIESFKRYPLRAREEEKEGITHLRFTILRNGQVSELELVSSSGYRILDQEALSLIKRASPFSPFPENIKRERLTLQLPVKFIIDRE